MVILKFPLMLIYTSWAFSLQKNYMSVSIDFIANQWEYKTWKMLFRHCMWSRGLTC